MVCAYGDFIRIYSHLKQTRSRLAIQSRHGSRHMLLYSRNKWLTVFSQLTVALHFFEWFPEFHSNSTPILSQTVLPHSPRKQSNMDYNFYASVSQKFDEKLQTRSMNTKCSQTFQLRSHQVLPIMIKELQRWSISFQYTINCPCSFSPKISHGRPSNRPPF